MGQPTGSDSGGHLPHGGDQVGQTGEILRSSTLPFNHGAYLLEQEYSGAGIAKVRPSEVARVAFAFHVQRDVPVDLQDSAIALR